MSRTVESPELKRRPIHDLPERSCKTSPSNVLQDLKMFVDKDSEAESSEEISDIVDVTGGNNGTNQKTGLYPVLTELERENAKYVFRKDAHGTSAAAEYSRTSVKTKYKTETDSTDSVPTISGSSLFIKVLCGFIVLISVVALCYVNWEVQPVKQSPPQVREIVNKLKNEYVNQPSLSFRIIKKALEKVLALGNMSEPLAPAVLLLMSTKGAKDETASFAQQLAELVAAGNMNYQTIYGDQLQSEDPDKAKKEIDDLIKGAPQYNRQIVVLIRDLDAIPSKAVMMLHGYCDHENAPLKNAVFIMTISTDADINNCESKHFDEAAESHLTNVWGDLGKDMLSALLSRVTVSVAAIYHKAKPASCR